MIFLLAFSIDSAISSLACLAKTSYYLNLKGHKTILVCSSTVSSEVLTGFLSPEVDGVIGNVHGCNCTVTVEDMHSGDYKAIIDEYINRLVNDSNLDTRKAYLRICQSLYTTYLAKSKDYGGAALKLTGTSGILTRAWDKMARLLHLAGFRYDLTMLPHVPPAPPENESVKDSWLDLASYSILALVNNKPHTFTMTLEDCRKKLEGSPIYVSEEEYNYIRNVGLFQIAKQENICYYELVRLLDLWYQGEDVKVL